MLRRIRLLILSAADIVTRLMGSILQSVQTGSGAHQASISVSNGVERPSRESDSTLSYSVEVEDELSCNFTLPYVVMAFRGRTLA